MDADQSLNLEETALITDRIEVHGDRGPEEAELTNLVSLFSNQGSSNPFGDGQVKDGLLLSPEVAANESNEPILGNIKGTCSDPFSNTKRPKFKLHFVDQGLNPSNSESTKSSNHIVLKKVTSSEKQQSKHLFLHEMFMDEVSPKGILKSTFSQKQVPKNLKKELSDNVSTLKTSHDNGLVRRQKTQTDNKPVSLFELPEPEIYTVQHGSSAYTFLGSSPVLNDNKVSSENGSNYSPESNPKLKLDKPKKKSQIVKMTPLQNSHVGISLTGKKPQPTAGRVLSPSRTNLEDVVRKFSK